MELTMRDLYERAQQAGREAAKNAEVTLIVVRGYEYQPFPICGFAWVNVPGNTPFGRWLLKNGHRKGYPKGVNIWISDYNQSYDLKLAHAEGMAKFLRDNGVTCYSDGRLD